MKLNNDMKNALRQAIYNDGVLVVGGRNATRPAVRFGTCLDLVGGKLMTDDAAIRQGGVKFTLTAEGRRVALGLCVHT